jgi:hypothetical protein
MRDQELSTRDLAETAGTEVDQSLGDQRPIDEPATGLDETGDQGPIAESAGADASLTRDPVAAEPNDAHLQQDQSLEAGHEPLLPSDQTERFTGRWQEIQTSFVDQPRDAVAEADALVADLMQRLAASFSQERERLEGQWNRGDDVSTEDLRIALTRYRSFFDRLLAA